MTRPEKRVNRLFLYGPVVVAAIVLLAYFFVWRAGAETMRRSVEDWADDQRAAGLDVSYEQVRTQGFPFFLRGAVAEPVIAEPSGAAWSAEALYIDALPYALDRLVFSATNPQRLDLGDYGVWMLTAKNGRASVANDPAREWILNVQSEEGALVREGDEARLSAGEFLLTIAPSADDPSQTEASLIVDALAGELETGAFAAPRLETFLGVREDPAARTEIDLRRFYLETEGAKAQLQGTFRLDAAGYPEGRVQADIANPAGLATALHRLGALTREEADAAAAALTLAALAGGGRLAAPIDMQNGVATIAGVKIADLPRLR